MPAHVFLEFRANLNLGAEAMFSSACQKLILPSSLQRVDIFASISSEICMSSGQFIGRKERREKVLTRKEKVF